MSEGPDQTYVDQDSEPISGAGAASSQAEAGKDAIAPTRRLEVGRRVRSRPRGAVSAAGPSVGAGARRSRSADARSPGSWAMPRKPSLSRSPIPRL